MMDRVTVELFLLGFGVTFVVLVTLKILFPPREAP